MNLHDRLDAELEQITGQDPQTYVVAGRHALARRRLASGVAALAVTGGLVTGVALVAPGGGTAGPAAHQSPSTHTTSSHATSGPRQAHGTEKPDCQVIEDACVSSDGELELAPGLTLKDRIWSPLGKDSAAIEVLDGHARAWLFVTGQDVTREEPRRAFDTLRLWTKDMRRALTGRTPKALVRFTDDGSLSPVDGVTMVDQTTDPKLGARFSGPNDPTAVAEVTVDGRTWFVAARHVQGGRPEYFPISTARAGTSLDEAVRYMRHQYRAGDEGLR